MIEGTGHPSLLGLLYGILKLDWVGQGKSFPVEDFQVVEAILLGF